MGRKKKPAQEEAAKEEAKKEEREPDSDDDSSSDYVAERRHHDIDPEIQQLAYTFRIEERLLQKLNDIMIEEREKTWEQDLARLYEILKDAHTPSAMLNLKLKDMEKGKFVGKAKCGQQVKDLARKHRLDKGASSKLEEAMSMREAMGKDCSKDLQLLDEHLAASNAPSKLVSMKLEALRKGYNIGHSIYSREVVAGNQGPGVDGVLGKKGPRPLGYTDADLDRRFADIPGASGGQLMDEATIKKMMAAEKRKALAAREEDEDEEEKPSKKDKKDRGRRDRSRSRGSPRRGRKSRSRSGKKKSRSRSAAKKGKRKTGRGKSKSRSRRGRSSPSVARKRRGRSSPSVGRDRKPKKSRSRSAKKKESTSKGRRSRSRSGKPKGKKEQAKKKEKEKSGSPSRSRARAAAAAAASAKKEKAEERDKEKE